MSEKRFTTGTLLAEPENVDREKGVIYGAKIVEVGEAKGHEMWIDSAFVDQVVMLGNDLKQGIKARFGHPNMCSTALGTFVGRWKGLYRDGDTARGNLFLSNTAIDTPNGNLREYVVNMAEKDADMFGVSIAFNRDPKAEPVIDDASGFEIPTIVKLNAADVVDSPAATDGLFSRFSGETVAGQVTEFLNDNPTVLDKLYKSPEVLGALANYPDKIAEFMANYKTHTNQGAEMATLDTPEKTEEEILAEAEAAEAVKLAEATKLAEAEAAEAVKLAEAKALADAKKTPAEQLSKEEFAKIETAFGADIAADAMKNDGSYSSALQQFADKQTAEIETLKAQLSTDNGTPAANTGLGEPKRRPFENM